MGDGMDCEWAPGAGELDAASAARDAYREARSVYDWASAQGY